MQLFQRVGSVFVLGLMLAACTSTKNFDSTINTAQIQSENRVVLMPVDIELSLMTASGSKEPRAEWTESAKRHVEQAILEFKDQQGFNIVASDYSLLDGQTANDAVDLERLHRAVGNAIVTHKYGVLKLPTKERSFDWTLGQAVRNVAATYDADHVLFVFVRDSYTSAGRRTLQVLASLVGVAVQTGQTAAFASLVDAESGDITWFNVLSSTGADLRDFDGSQSFVEKLFDTIPLESGSDAD